MHCAVGVSVSRYHIVLCCTHARALIFWGVSNGVPETTVHKVESLQWHRRRWRDKATVGLQNIGSGRPWGVVQLGLIHESLQPHCSRKVSGMQLEINPPTHPLTNLTCTQSSPCNVACTKQKLAFDALLQCGFECGSQTQPHACARYNRKHRKTKMNIKQFADISVPQATPKTRTQSMFVLLVLVSLPSFWFVLWFVRPSLSLPISATSSPPHGNHQQLQP